jgi:hypothetical protein
MTILGLLADQCIRTQPDECALVVVILSTPQGGPGIINCSQDPVFGCSIDQGGGSASRLVREVRSYPGEIVAYKRFVIEARAGRKKHSDVLVQTFIHPK